MRICRVLLLGLPGSNAGALGTRVLRGSLEGLRLRQKINGLVDHGIPIGPHSETFFLAELGGKDLRLDVRLDPVDHLSEVLVRIGNLLAGKKLLKSEYHTVVYLEVFADRTRGHVVAGEVEESIVLKQGILKLVGLWGVD